MARCGYCNSRILFGGIKDADLVFCNETCHEGGYLLAVADQIPEGEMQQQIWEVHQGTCPKCNGSGPVDVHTSHSVWSLLLMTSWHSTPHICCRRCGIKAQLGDGAFSLLLGWWGIPWGLVITPVQLVRNVVAIARPYESSEPSEELAKQVRIAIAAEAVANQPALEEPR